MSNTDAARSPSEPYFHPYVAGAGLGLTLLLSYLVLGTGLGASGSSARLAAAAAHTLAPEAVESNGYLQPWFDQGANPLAHYLVFMSLGTLAGGFASAVLARRTGIAVERGAHVSALGRLTLALAGGVLVGFASRLAGGCTSGVGLTGAAQLIPGAWAFLAAMFAAGYAVAPLARKEWSR